MKRFLLIIFSLSLILTVFAFIFFDGYDTKKVGMAAVRYKSHTVNKTAYYSMSNSSYQQPGAFQYILDDTFVLSVVFDIGNYEKGYTPAGTYTAKGYISYRVDEAVTPGGQIVFTTDPFPVTCNVFYPEALADDVDIEVIRLILYDYEINFDSFTFIGVINNASALYWENSMKFEDVENIVDFGIFILDFIKSLFVLIGKIFYAVGYFF